MEKKRILLMAVSSGGILASFDGFLSLRTFPEELFFAFVLGACFTLLVAVGFQES